MKARALWITLITLVMIGPALGQPEVEWEITFGCDGNDFPLQLLELSDGGILVTWRNGTAYQGPFHISKISPAGALLWDHIYSEEMIMTEGINGNLYGSPKWLGQNHNYSPRITAFSSQGDSLWFIDYESSGSLKTKSFFATLDGNLCWIGEESWFNNDQFHTHIVAREYSIDGQFISENEMYHYYYGTSGYTLHMFRQTQAGEFLAMFEYYSIGDPPYWPEYYTFVIEKYNANYELISDVDPFYGTNSLYGLCEYQDGYYAVSCNEAICILEQRASFVAPPDSANISISVSRMGLEPHSSGGVIASYGDSGVNDYIRLKGFRDDLSQAWCTEIGTIPLGAYRILKSMSAGDYIIACDTEPMDSVEIEVYIARFSAALPAHESVSNRPSILSLIQNHPNPFNPVTEIEYQIASPSLTTLKVYDVLGREVASLVNGVKSAGNYTVMFDGSELPSGVYIYRLQAGEFSQSRKMVLLK